LSDGGDTASKKSGAEAAELAGRLKIPVSVVTLQSTEFNPEPIADVARKSGGHVLAALSSSALEGLYDGLAAELHQGYQLTFTSREKKNEAKVDVEANIDGRRLTASTLVEGLPQIYKPVGTPAEPRPINRLERIALPWFAAGLAFVAVFLLVVSIGSYLTSGKNTLAEQLKYYDQLRGRREAGDGDKPRVGRLQEGLVNFVRATSIKYEFANYAQGKLEQAGLPVRPHEYMTMHFLGVAAISLTTVLAFGAGFFTFLLIALAVFGPLLAVEVLIERRKAIFNNQLPDTIDMIASSLRAGYGLQQAIVAAGRDAREPTSGELSKVSNQVQMGMTLEGALDKMADRIGDTAFRWVVLAIAIHRETGGNLAELLDNLAASLRQRESTRRQIKALTAEGRLSAIILIVLPFAEAALMFAFNPTYMGLLFTSLPGLGMIAAALTLMTMGALWLKSMTNVEY
ncbi:MAG: type II secretion system F family protein, partial [Actinomycetota bacterium]|nr:type II secretion system F family protein [Actinomycetota bacterium]